MLSTLSSNVIIAKALAMYGKRLTDEDYRNLMACQTVGEVASYLKNRTVYRKTLAGINENNIHRGQLEARLRQKLFEDYALLCRYEISIGEHFSRYLIVRSEIEQILQSIIFLNSGKPEEYLFDMPDYLNQHTHINLAALALIKDFDGLLDALQHTPYQKLLEPFAPQPGEKIDYMGIENKLYTYLFSNVFEVIDKHTHGEAAKQLREIFNSYVDLLNYTRIVRLKFFYNAEPEFIRKSLLPFGDVNPRILEEMIAAENEQQVTAVMGKTSAGKRFLNIPYTYVDEIPNRAKYKLCRHNIHFSTHSSVVLMSYVFITQAEITDIITIIESIRYKLPPEEIAKLLTVYNSSRKE